MFQIARNVVFESKHPERIVSRASDARRGVSSNDGVPARGRRFHRRRPRHRATIDAADAAADARHGFPRRGARSRLHRRSTPRLAHRRRRRRHRHHTHRSFARSLSEAIDSADARARAVVARARAGGRRRRCEGHIDES